MAFRTSCSWNMGHVMLALDQAGARHSQSPVTADKGRLWNQHAPPRSDGSGQYCSPLTTIHLKISVSGHHRIQIWTNCPQIRHCSPNTPRSRITVAQSRNYGCKCRRTSRSSRPPGTEFLDAETGRQKLPLEGVSGHRDQNSRSEGPEIPARRHDATETRHAAKLRRYRKE